MAAPGRQPAVLLLILGLHALLLWGLLIDPRVRVLLPQALPLFVKWVEEAPTRAPMPEPQPRLSPRAASPVTLPGLTPPEVQVRITSEMVNAAPVPQPAQPMVPPELLTVAPSPALAPTAPPPHAAPTPPVPAPAIEPQVLDAALLRVTEAPRVEYPRASRRNKESGVVWVRAWVGSSGGESSDIRIDRSSGFARLDEAALRAVQQARFAPALKNGRTTEGWALIPIQFELEA
ncbi:MAG: TonB family protein [Rubrivivax sp.]